MMEMSRDKTEERLEPIWTTEITTVKSEVSLVPLEKRLAKRFLGLLFASISGLSVTVSSVCRKHLSKLPATQLVAHRYVGAVLYSLPAMSYYHQTPLQSKKLTAVLSLRGFCLGTGYTLAFLSLNYIPLAEFSVLSGSTPVFAALLARIFLKEECGLVNVLCLILTMLGVILVSKLPVILLTRTIPYDLSYYKGIAMTLLLAVLFALGAISVRAQEVKSIHYSVILFYLGTASVVECIILSNVYGFSQLLCSSEIWLVILLSVAGIGIDVFGTLALKYQPTAISVMVYSSSNIICSYIWQIAVDGIEPDAYTISGTGVMILCIVLLTLKQTVSVNLNWKIFNRS